MVIYRHKDKYCISEMCRFFNVSRSGYYDYVKRMDIPAKDREDPRVSRQVWKDIRLSPSTYMA